MGKTLRFPRQNGKGMPCVRYIEQLEEENERLREVAMVALMCHRVQCGKCHWKEHGLCLFEEHAYDALGIEDDDEL